MNFLDTIKDDQNAVNIYNLNISNYNFSDGTEREVTDAEGNVTCSCKSECGWRVCSMTIDMLFYNARRSISRIWVIKIRQQTPTFIERW